jgi:hypothetical protein
VARNLVYKFGRCVVWVKIRVEFRIAVRECLVGKFEGKYKVQQIR